MKVLACDGIHEDGLALFREAGWTVEISEPIKDPAKLAKALVQLTSQDEPPLRWVAGADAVPIVEQKAKDLLAQADAYRELSSNLAHDDA